MDLPTPPAETTLPNLGADVTGTAKRTDQDLLLAVGRHQDRQAFAEIHSRYHKQAYSLALHLTGHSAIAEEAVQEAMLRVWKYATTYKKEGSARGWLFQVFAQGSLHVARKEGRGRGHQRPLLSQPEVGDPRDPLSESREVLAALGRELASLPDRDRKLVALRYGAGLSQDQIAVELQLTQRAVSYRNQVILERLRANLIRAGFAAALPLLERHLGTALLDGVQPPAGLQAQLASRLESVLQSSPAGPAAKGASTALWAGAAVVLAAAAGTGWWALGNSGPGTRAPEQAAAGPAPGVPAASEAQAFAQSRKTWRFDKPEDSAGLSLIAGSKWHWVPGAGPDGSGCMETDSPWFSIVLDAPAERLPLQVTYQVQNRLPRWDKDGWAKWLLWSRNKNVADFWYIAPQNWQSADPNPPWRETRFLVTERFTIMLSGVAMHLVVSERESGAKLQLGLQGKHRLDNLKVAPVDPKEIPDVSRYLSALDKIPAEKQVGVVELPEFPSPVPGKKVSIFFFPQLMPSEPVLRKSE